MREGEGVEGGENTCLAPLSNKEVMFQWKATINLDMGTQALIDLILRCPVFSEVAAKKLHLPSSPRLHIPLPHWAQACWCLSSSSSKNKVCTKKMKKNVRYAGFAARACLRIIWHSSGQALLLPEITLKFKWHDGRLSSAPQQASLLVEKRKKKKGIVVSRMERRATLSRERSVLYWSSCEVLFSIRCIILRTHLTFLNELVWNSHIKKKKAGPGGWPLCAHAV